MENNNGKGIFYGVIGVATLIVAIIGATFAYFSATTISGQYVTGTAATASLSVAVQRMTGFSAGEGADVTTSNAKFTMVPQLDVGLSAAIRGSSVTENKPCIDANGSLVCSIYKITVQNTGSAAIDVSGKINFYVTGAELTGNGEDGTALEDVKTDANLMNHLKWARLADPANAYTSFNDGKGIPRYTRTQADAVTAVPTDLLVYGTTAYEVLPNGDEIKYANAAANQYLYARTVAKPSSFDTMDDKTKKLHQDLLGTTSTVVYEHGAYTDLIDPTDDLVAATYATNDEPTWGQIHLSAKDIAGDTRVFYIVVWISENNAEQNDYDYGTFAGQVTFESAGGSGATSTFTEAYQAG